MKKILKNLFFGFGSHLIVLAMSVILPRFILISFGSEVNGIATTITQIFTYIALLEAGIGASSLNRLYKDIAANDRAEISTTVSATRKYFNKVLPIYTACIILFAVFYPFFVKTDVPDSTIRLIIAIQGIGGIVNFYFTNTYALLLLADGRNYISSIMSLLVKTTSTIAQILLILSGFDIVSVQLSLTLAYILKAIIINIYVKRKYPWLQKNPDADIKRLEQRSAYVIHEISYAIFNGTDIFVISVFCSIKEASVYSIYNMVFVAVSAICSVLFNGIDFKLGAEYHRDLNKYKKMHDCYELIVSCFVFSIISAVYVVILPFIKLYTDGVTDINYIHPILPLLFSLVQLLSSSRLVSQKLITISGRAKNTLANSITETLLNITVSLILVNILGMPGVLIGTIAALLYRTNDMIIYANTKILKRRPWYTYKTMAINFVLFALVVLFANQFPLNINNYISFLIFGSVVLLITSILFFGIHCVLNKSLRGVFLSTVKRIKTKSIISIKEEKQ